MTQFLPPNLLALFAPRDPIPYLPPVDKLPHEKRTEGYSGISDFVQFFEDPSKTPPAERIRTKEERQEEKRQWKKEQTILKLEQDIALWKPNDNPDATSDPHKTLFVARIHYDTSENKLLRVFEVYGPVKAIKLIKNKLTDNPRGYAFIEYFKTSHMHYAYKDADGKKIGDKRVLVDYERGRTIREWLPRRLGGGLGDTRRGGPEVNSKHSGRVEESRLGDRFMGRDRDRKERRRSRSKERSRSRERRRRSRSRDRYRPDRHRGGDRPRDRERGRDHDPMANPEVVGIEGGPGGPDPAARKDRRRSSRDRERRHRRSRSRDRGDRERRHRDRDDRDGKRDRRDDREEPKFKEEMPMDMGDGEQVQDGSSNMEFPKQEYPDEEYNNGENNDYFEN